MLTRIYLPISKWRTQHQPVVVEEASVEASATVVVAAGAVVDAAVAVVVDVGPRKTRNGSLSPSLDGS